MPDNHALTIAGTLTLCSKNDWESETAIDIADGKSKRRLVDLKETIVGGDGMPKRVAIHLQGEKSPRYFTCIQCEPKAEDENHGLRSAAWRETDKEGTPKDDKI